MAQKDARIVDENIDVAWSFMNQVAATSYSSLSFCSNRLPRTLPGPPTRSAVFRSLGARDSRLVCD
jgi:hypothetical protein